jgi:ssDNA-binding Zn-finger/Zn-ribbon topoisomerase 1
MLKLPYETDHREIEWSRKVEGFSHVSFVVCPECGSKMVRRCAKKGSGTFSQFWGCSAFPKCKVIKAINH